MTEVKIEYPKYYRKGTKCLKRESDVQAMVVVTPLPERSIPLGIERIFYPSKERLDEEVTKMDEVDQDTYDSHLALFYQTSEKNREKFNEYRQARFDNQGRV